MVDVGFWTGVDLRKQRLLGRFVGQVDDVEQADAEARAWLASNNPEAFVGSRHHVVPRLLLERWANDREQVRVFRRIENRFDTCNIRDLAIEDFCTVIDIDGRKNSAMESLIGVVESATKPIIDDLLSPWRTHTTIEDIVCLAQFASFQATRTPRPRREIELEVEWYAKTIRYREDAADRGNY